MARPVCAILLLGWARSPAKSRPDPHPAIALLYPVPRTQRALEVPTNPTTHSCIHMEAPHVPALVPAPGRAQGASGPTPTPALAWWVALDTRTRTLSSPDPSAFALFLPRLQAVRDGKHFLLRWSGELVQRSRGQGESPGTESQPAVLPWCQSPVSCPGRPQHRAAAPTPCWPNWLSCLQPPSPGVPARTPRQPPNLFLPQKTAQPRPLSQIRNAGVTSFTPLSPLSARPCPALLLLSPCILLAALQPLQGPLCFLIHLLK